MMVDRMMVNRVMVDRVIADRRIVDRTSVRGRSPLLYPAIGITADDAQSRPRHFGRDQGPDLTAKIFDAVDVRLPVHGSHEGEKRRGCARRIRGHLVSLRRTRAILRDRKSTRLNSSH